MSFCVDKGKDKILFLAKDDDAPSTYEGGKDAKSQPDIDDEADGAGLILPSGEINWNCPCLGGLAVGPCSVEFREAFSCFHNSKEELKGSECVEKFKQMHECMNQYPDLYSNFTGMPDDDGDEDEDDTPINIGEATALQDSTGDSGIIAESEKSVATTNETDKSK